jgi:hypothetical protein
MAKPRHKPGIESDTLARRELVNGAYHQSVLMF